MGLVFRVTVTVIRFMVRIIRIELGLGVRVIVSINMTYHNIFAHYELSNRSCRRE